MARTPGPSQDREFWLHVRLTAQESRDLDAARGEVSRSEHVRRLLHQRKGRS